MDKVESDQPREPRLRTAFNIFAAVAGVFGLGLEVEGSHPYIGLLLMVAALAYGAWELFTSPVAIQKFSGRRRIAFLAILSGLLLFVSWPHLKQIVIHNSAEQSPKAALGQGHIEEPVTPPNSSNVEMHGTADKVDVNSQHHAPQEKTTTAPTHKSKPLVSTGPTSVNSPQIIGSEIKSQADTEQAPTSAALPPVDATKTPVQPLDPSNPNYEYLKRGCPPPQPGTAVYFCNGSDNDIRDFKVTGAFSSAFQFYNMKRNKIENFTFDSGGQISVEDHKLLEDLVAQYGKEHPGFNPDQQLVDWINAQLTERGKQFQVHLTPP